MPTISLRIPFMLLAITNLLIGIIAGLLRIGWELPVNSVAVHHGALMVGGFLGTLILLEKVIPLKKNIFLLLPFLNALGVLVAIPDLYRIGVAFLLLGAVSLLFVFIYYLKNQPGDMSVHLMILGAISQITGHIMLITKLFYPMAFPWWMGFILFIIVGERLELSKFLPVTKKNKNTLLVFTLLFLTGVCLPFHSFGKYISGFGLCLIALWLLRHDIISLSLRKNGLQKFSGIALLTGCLALLLTGIFLLTLPALTFAYDAIVHTFFLGFAFSMIFAHGPFILPGVLGLAIKPFHPVLYLPLITLLSSLMLRILCDLSVLPYFLRLPSGWGSAASIVLYFILLIVLTIRSSHAKSV
jgi:hypothetical protein